MIFLLSFFTASPAHACVGGFLYALLSLLGFAINRQLAAMVGSDSTTQEMVKIARCSDSWVTTVAIIGGKLTI